MKKVRTGKRACLQIAKLDETQKYAVCEMEAEAGAWICTKHWSVLQYYIH